MGQYLSSPEEIGPVFDFMEAGVVRAADAVVASAALLNGEIGTLPAEAFAGDEAAQGRAYEACMAILTRRMPSLYAAYDAYIEAVLATGRQPVTCRAECPACCAHYVTSVEPVELLWLDAHLRRSAQHADQLFAMHERATAYRKVYRPDEGDEAEDKALHRYFLIGKKCPFLTAKGECGVRGARPMSCRMFFSYSDPKYCRGRQIVSPANRNFHVGLPDEAERLLAQASGVLQALNLSEHLFDGLLQVNEALGRFVSA